MEKEKSVLAILGLGITIGVVLAVILVFVVGAMPKKVIIGGVEFEIPTAITQSQPTAVLQQAEQQPTVSYPTSTQSLLAISTTMLTNGGINNLVGAGNWFCLPDIQDAIGIIKLPQGFIVKYPIGNIDSNGIKYHEGEVVHGISGTAWLSSSLSPTECPPEQQVALENWRTQSSNPITRELINSVIGAGNWSCTGVTWNVTVKSFPFNWIVQFPFTSADINGEKIGIGYAVSDGNTGTLNMVNMPREECP